MASAEKENSYLAHLKTAPPKAEGYEDPFDGCIPRKVSADKAKGILNGQYNPFTRQLYSDKYKKILEGRRKLPVFAQMAMEEFYKIFNENQIVVMIGETGSGKTTQIPQFVAYTDIPHARGKLIACMQPRRVAAMSVAKRVAEEMDAMTDHDLSRYSTIILDKAHERTLATDILMGLLKEVAKCRKDLKIVVMSATLDTLKFQKYFSTGGEGTTRHSSIHGHGGCTHATPPITISLLASRAGYFGRDDALGRGIEPRVFPRVQPLAS
ncbi:DEAH-box ATP-dependent RNA helicase prp43 [Ceratobasidium sp. 423]|nr:DEAH-box ATP-dependent RNA helicase prp43 [Ceratobasidium sp. 423]